MAARPVGPHLAVTFDVDGPSNWIGTLGSTLPSVVSRGEFEPIGIRRVLRLLDEFLVPATFFIPGSTALLYPRLVEAMVTRGDEIGHHGWVHENPSRLTDAKEREVLERGLEALDKVAHVKPPGYRSPGWDNSPRTADLLVEHGFEYDSSMFGSDFEPYWCRTGDVVSADEGFQYGRPLPLVEMPVSWHLDDFPQFEPVTLAGLSMTGLRTPATPFEIWCSELDYLCDRVKSGVMIITLHPQVMGRGHRMTMLQRFFEYVASKGNVRYTRCGQYARQWREGREPSLPDLDYRP